MAVAELPPPAESVIQATNTDAEEVARDGVASDEPEVSFLDRMVSLLLFLSLFGLALITLIGVLVKLWQG